MLPRTFLFLPGIGPVREARLWKRGVRDWTDYRSMGRINGVRAKLKAQHDTLLDLAEASLGVDPRFFAQVLPEHEQWRAFPHFRDSAAYIDIETRGERDNNDITVVGVRMHGESRIFVRGVNYDVAAVSSLLRKASCLVTFNGNSFDLPVLAADGVQFPKVPQVDLRVVLHRAGYEGGLKKIEESLGLQRDEAVRGMSGYDAVKLWRRWEQSGDEEALDRLMAYNAADFENLEPLADHACEALTTKLLSEATVQSRLPLLSATEAPAGP